MEIKPCEESQKISNKTEKENSKKYEFFVNNNKRNKKYKFKNNKVDTTKYNLFTFLPKALLIQYLRPETIYYLFFIIVENIPLITPLIPVSTIVPYSIVLSICIFREGLEDYFRYKYDKALNNEPTTVFRKGKWKSTKSGSLKVGEFVVVKEDSPFPADLILLDSNLVDGVAFVETSTLDGEKTLKKKYANKKTASLFNENGEFKASLEKFEWKCVCDLPNSELYKFNGILELEKGSVVPINNQQLLLKGAVLRNTKWVVGLVTYVGHNTKIILNSKKSTIKYSKVFKFVSRVILYILLIQAAFCATCAGLNSHFYHQSIYKANYVKPYVLSPEGDSALIYITYMIIFKFMIPITLYVTLEAVRAIQAYFIWVNIDMYSHVRKQFVKVGSISLVEELGDVNYVFSDKTGTLTCNKMDLKYCVVGDTCYEFLKAGDLTGEKLQARNHFNEEMGIKLMELNYLESLTNNGKKYEDLKITSSTNEENFIEIEDETSLLNEYWKALCLAHECSAEEKNNKLEYIGLSPDDIELVKGAALQGYALEKSENNAVRKVKIAGNEHNFEVLNLFEFSSERKKLSIIVKDNDKIKLYIKGADSEIKKILSENSREVFNSHAKHYVDLFSTKGYRTLYVGMKIIDEEEYKEWSKIYDAANLNLENKKEAVERAQELMEKNIYLLGATVVEDRLQDKVPETIRDLRLAGIKVWMLTGDKMDTAYNIGLSCNLISKDIQTFMVSGEKGESPEKLYSEYEIFQKSYKFSKITPAFSIVLDSTALSQILASKENIKIFINISNKAVSVICSRVSPLQKAQVVKIMKEHHPNAVTLAIGDGGNDVSMILEANLGKYN